jgi:ferritin
MDKKRLSTNVISLLDKCIKQESDSSALYEAMSVWRDSNGFEGGKKLYEKYAEEERRHLVMLADFMLSMGCFPTIPSQISPTMDYKNISEVVEASLQHEYAVTDGYKQVAKILRSSNEDLTYAFIQWFLREQVEEEAKFLKLSDRIRLCGESLILIDNLMKELA